MKNTIYIVIFFLTSIQVFSQEHIVIDSTTMKPISFANILYNNDGVYSNENGVFKINNQSNDSITILHIGYNKYKSVIDKLRDTVFLQPKTENLQ